MLILQNLLQVPELQELKRVLGQEADLHLVGGSVRDALLGVKPKDLDLATKLTPKEMIAKLEATSTKFVPTGIRRGTLTILINKVPLEVTTFRNPGCETQFTKSIQEDLPARDFTINAIALSLNTGKLVDPFDGKGDLDRGIVRSVGDAETRFREDPHRILRMIRFGAGAERQTHMATKMSAQKLAPLLKDVSVERITAELNKILLSADVTGAFRQMEKLGILEVILPEIIPCVGLEQNKHHKLDVFNHILFAISLCPKDLTVRLAALFHDIAKPQVMTNISGRRQFLDHQIVGPQVTRDTMKRLKHPKDLTEKVCKLVELHMRPIHMKRPGIRRLIRETGDLLPQWIQLKKADTLAGRNLEFDFDKDWETFTNKIQEELDREKLEPTLKLAVTGKDILGLGIKEGPKIGRLISLLTEIVIESPEKNTKEALMSVLDTLILE